MLSGKTLGLHTSHCSIPFVVQFVQLMEVEEASSLADVREGVVQSLEVLVAHLDGGRAIAKQSDIYQENAILNVNHRMFEKELLDVFRTEMHMNLLWGSRGAVVEHAIRYEKYNQLLAAMSLRIQR